MSVIIDANHGNIVQLRARRTINVLFERMSIASQTPSLGRWLPVLIAAASLFAVLPKGQAQLGDRLARAAQRGAERAIERKAEEKAAEAVEDALSGPKDPGREDNTGGGGGMTEDEANESSSETPGGQVPSERSAPGAESGAKSTSDGSSGAGNSFRMDSKYDFEPGTTVLYYDDFERASIGDFPTGYNSNGSAEVVSVSTAPGKWLRVNAQTEGVHFMNVQDLPRDFTLEFDVIHDIPAEGYRYTSGLGTIFTDLKNPETRLDEHLRLGTKAATFWIERDLSRGWTSEMTKWTEENDYSRGSNTRLDAHFSDATRGTPQHVAFWRQGRRIRMYVNQQKVYDIPLAWPDENPIASVRLFAKLSEEADSYLVSNLRIAKGAPDTRSKLVTEGKLTTYGITFASGSDKVEPASAGTLKAIAQVLQENPAMRLRITGHTDTVGAAETNQALSERRAAAVKAVLVSNYGVAGERLTTAGAGESTPIATGDTSEAKAQNRRVVLDVVK